MNHSIKNFVRLYKPPGSHSQPFRDHVDFEVAALGVQDMKTLHDMVRIDDKFCAYSTFQVSVITDDNGLEHRSGPINESRMVKFGEIKLGQDVRIPVYTGWMSSQMPYSDQHPETLNKPLVLCGGNISKADHNDIVYDRATGNRLWPVPVPRTPTMEP